MIECMQDLVGKKIIGVVRNVDEGNIEVTLDDHTVVVFTTEDREAVIIQVLEQREEVVVRKEYIDLPMTKPGGMSAIRKTMPRKFREF